MTYKDDLVACIANDVEKTINLKLKEESEDAYRAMIEYILRLVNAGFPRDCQHQLETAPLIARSSV